MYNDYKLGQWIYVKCEGLTIGQYEGVLQLGFSPNDSEQEKLDKNQPVKYETSYLDVELLINKHIISCLLYTSPSPRDKRQSRMPSSA